MVKLNSAIADNAANTDGAGRSLLRGERWAYRINNGWKGDFVADATAAAFQYGLLSGRALTQDRALYLLRFWFHDIRKVDAKHWDTVYYSFLSGRDTEITLAELIDRLDGPAPANDNNLIDPTVFQWEDPATIPVRDWIYGKHLIRRHVSATIAAGAVGKTSLKIVEALSLATGRPLLGQEVPKRCYVWLFNLEDDLVELRRRVSAAMIHYNIKPEDIGDRLLIDGEKSLIITKTDKDGTTINEPVVEAIVEAINVRKIDVLIVDPFISSHNAPESDSGAMDLIMKSGWVRVARDGNCAVELCHHTTKADTSSGAATAMSGRGSGAVVFACRSVMVLNPMTPDEAKKAGLESPSGYFSVLNDKENLTPPTRMRDWYKMTGVSLGNGGKGNLAAMRSDNIGVATRWQWPTRESFVEDVTDEQLRVIKERLGAGRYRKDAQASAWAGYVVGEVLGLGSSKETLDGHDKRRVASMLEAWLKDSRLEVYKEKVNREFKEFVA